jgi:hypothetical protein
MNDRWVGEVHALVSGSHSEALPASHLCSASPAKCYKNRPLRGFGDLTGVSN